MTPAERAALFVLLDTARLALIGLSKTPFAGGTVKAMAAAQLARVEDAIAALETEQRKRA